MVRPEHPRLAVCLGSPRLMEPAEPTPAQPWRRLQTRVATRVAPRTPILARRVARRCSSHTNLRRRSNARRSQRTGVVRQSKAQLVAPGEATYPSPSRRRRSARSDSRGRFPLVHEQRGSRSRREEQERPGVRNRPIYRQGLGSSGRWRRAERASRSVTTA